MKQLFVYGIELPCQQGDVSHTLTELEKKIESLHLNSDLYNNIVVLPENFLFYHSDLDLNISFANYLDEIKVVELLAQISKKYKIFLLAGSIPFKSSEGLKARSFIFGTEGETIGYYDKIHLFKASVNGTNYSEETIYMPGRDLLTFSVDDIKIGVAICFDLRFSNMFYNMRKNQVDVFLIPAAFAKKTGELHWEVLLRARAIESQSYVVGVGLNGKSDCGYECYGNSMIINPLGEIIDIATSKNCISSISSIIDKDLIVETRRKIQM